MSLHSQLIKSVRHNAHKHLVRMRLLEQMALLSRTGYFTTRFKAAASMEKTPAAFMAAFLKTARPSNIRPKLRRLVWHSLAVTLLIARGDEPVVRKSVGVLLERKSPVKGLSYALQTFPAIYSAVLSNLPPQPSKDTLSVALLRCA